MSARIINFRPKPTRPQRERWASIFRNRPGTWAVALDDEGGHRRG